MRIPTLPRPKEIPARTAKERSDHDHSDPQDMETQKKSQDLVLSVFETVVAVALRIDVDKRDHHQTDDDETGHNYARVPWIEINQHFLQAKKVPGRLRRIGRARR